MNRIVPKGLDGLLNDAPNLTRKVTHQQFLKRNPHKEACPEHSIEDAYAEYREILDI